MVCKFEVYFNFSAKRIGTIEITANEAAPTENELKACITELFSGVWEEPKENIALKKI